MTGGAGISWVIGCATVSNGPSESVMGNFVPRQVQDLFGRQRLQNVAKTTGLSD
jgi:uncharacterized protein YidB (DUF937 family)